MMKIGTASSSMELIPGMDMTGYLGRASSSTGVHDPLMVRCIVFNDGATVFTLVVCDLLALDSRFARETAKMVGHKTAIPSENIVIACTHTHSGPASIFLQDCGTVSDDWLNRLQPCIAGCAEKAMKAMKPSQLAYKTSSSDIGKNRVLKDESAYEKVDKQVGIAIVKDAATGNIDSLLINYACHPVVLDEANSLYTKDYPHFMEEDLKAKLGSGINVIFATGCCGDVDPAKRGSFDTACRLGRKLAGSIMESILHDAEELDLSNSSIKIRTFNIDIPLKHRLTDESVRRLIGEFEKKLQEESIRNGENPSNSKNSSVKEHRAALNWALKMQQMIKDGTLPASIHAELKVINIGDLTIVTLPFEAFHDIGIKIKEYFGTRNTMVICYANGDYGYMPSRALYAKAAYEAGEAYRYYGYPGPVCENAEDIIYKAIFS